MINDLAKRKYEGLVRELDTLDEMSASEVQRLKIKLTRVSAKLKDLRTQLPAYGSVQEEEEIEFFSTRISGHHRFRAKPRFEASIDWRKRKFC